MAMGLDKVILKAVHGNYVLLEICGIRESFLLRMYNDGVQRGHNVKIPYG